MNRRLRVLHVGNGRAHKIRAIIDALRARGHEMHMVPIPPVPEGFDGVTWHDLPCARWPGQLRTLQRMIEFRRLVHRIRPDIVHAHNAWGPGWYGAFCGVHPFVIHAYGGDLLPEQYCDRPLLQRQITAWTCNRADRIIVTGQHMIQAARALNIPAEKMVLLPRGVDLKLYRPGLDASALRAQLDLHEADPIILSPRYQVDEALYNLDIVIEAFAEFCQAHPQAVCLQMHDPARTKGVARLEALARKFGLGNRYRLVPSVRNDLMPFYYNLADVAVSVPSSDGFPVTVLEASACECPLIVSDLPYCREWFTPGKNGIIVPARDARELAGAMRRAFEDRAALRRMGAAGRRLVQERADYEVCMDRLESLYFSLLTGQTHVRN